jgi:hypothetical protein
MNFLYHRTHTTYFLPTFKPTMARDFGKKESDICNLKLESSLTPSGSLLEVVLDKI